MPDCDVLIVGSGPCGTAAAAACVRAGATTLLLDGGIAAPPPPPSPAPSHFVQLRREDPDQWRHLLGEDLSGVPLGDLGEGKGGGNLDGDRGYVTRHTDELLPVEAHHTAVIQSLAVGGLGSAWGGVCAMWSADELRAAGLPPDEIQRHYQSVSDRIGVSGPSGEFRLMAPVHLDLHGSAILRAARHRHRQLRRLGATVEQPPLALLTEDRPPRRACSYSDLEYLSDPGRSVWRPADTLDQLSEAAAFRRIGGVLVQRIEERADEIVVDARSISDGSLGGAERYTARHLLLAAGPLSTARILANSFGIMGTLPLLNKTHWIAARLHPRSLGQSGPERRTSLCQLLVRCRDAAHESSAQLYSYRSELLSRLLPSTPLPAPEALGLLALLTPALVMADVRFPIRSPNASVQLKGDRLVVRGCPSQNELAHRRRAFAALGRVLRILGLLPVSTLRLPEGSAFHYAGTVPHAPEACYPLTVDERGCVRRSRRLWVGDASVFRSMPPLSHTLTAMANAERTATQLMRCL